MRKLTVFESVTMNGYFAGPDGDMTWAYATGGGDDFDAFVAGNAKKPSAMLFGRVTYEMMRAYWPTAEAKKNAAAVAEGMNEAERVVFSKTLKKADWATVVHEDPLTHVRALKKTKGKDLLVLGSGSLVSQLAPLVDTLQLVVKPVVLGSGKMLFEGLKKPLSMTLTSSRSFKNGSVVLTYDRPA